MAGELITHAGFKEAWWIYAAFILLVGALYVTADSLLPQIGECDVTADSLLPQIGECDVTADSLLPQIGDKLYYRRISIINRA